MEAGTIWYAGLVLFLCGAVLIIINSTLQKKKSASADEAQYPQNLKTLREAYEETLDFEGDPDFFHPAFLDWDSVAIKEVSNARSLDELLEIRSDIPEDGIAEEIANLMHEEFSEMEVISAGDDIEKLATAARRAPKKGEARRTAIAKIRRLHLPVIRPEPTES